MLSDAQLFVRDFGSTNGTIVNGQKIAEDTELHHGDQLQMDKLVFYIGIETAESAAANSSSNGQKTKGESADDEAVAALLLELQDETPAAPVGESVLAGAEPTMGTTVLNAAPPPEQTSLEKAPAEQPRKKNEDATTADAAKGLLSKYSRRRKV